MLGSNKDGIINIDLSAINSIAVSQILCIGNTASDGKLRIYVSKNCAHRKTSCNSYKNSLFLLTCNSLPEEVKEVLIAENELLQNNSKAHGMSVTLNMYILVREENISLFLKEVYYKILSKKQLIFDNLGMYGTCVLARIVNTKYSFNERKALQNVGNQLLASAEYRAYDLEEENIKKEKSFQNYEIFIRTLNSIEGTTINKVTCIGNTEFEDNHLKVYVNNKNQKNEVSPYGTSLFMFVCKVPHKVVKADTTLTGISLGFKKRSSTTSRKSDSLFFIVFLLVFKDTLCTFLHEVYNNKKSCNIINPSKYGKVVLAYPLQDNIPSNLHCLPWEAEIIKELGILESAVESRLIILDGNESRTQLSSAGSEVRDDDTLRTRLLSSENEVRNYSTFSSFQEEEEITHSGNSGTFSKFRERVRTLFSNVRHNRIEYRNLNHQ
ncbi:DUF3023 domain-containing protein [Ehrlichia sp. JZT12]